MLCWRRIAELWKEHGRRTATGAAWSGRCCSLLSGRARRRKVRTRRAERIALAVHQLELGATSSSWKVGTKDGKSIPSILGWCGDGTNGPVCVWSSPIIKFPLGCNAAGTAPGGQQTALHPSPGPKHSLTSAARSAVRVQCMYRRLQERW